jgi:hypothetical protein
MCYDGALRAIMAFVSKEEGAEALLNGSESCGLDSLCEEQQIELMKAVVIAPDRTLKCALALIQRGLLSNLRQEGAKRILRRFYRHGPVWWNNEAAREIMTEVIAAVPSVTEDLDFAAELAEKIVRGNFSGNVDASEVNALSVLEGLGFALRSGANNFVNDYLNEKLFCIAQVKNSFHHSKHPVPLTSND